MPQKKSAVAGDVAVAMRKVIVARTPFDNTNYTLDIVPSKKWNKGWEADGGNWLMILAKVEGRLHQMDPAYGSLIIGPAGAAATREKSLSADRDYIAKKITGA